MVDQETFSRRLDALDLYLERAERLGEVAETEFAAVPSIHDLAERYLHLVTEAAIDLANHWIADKGLRTPESNRDTFSVLEESGEIDPALAERLRGWAGFRNVLVHQYANIDHHLLHGSTPPATGEMPALPHASAAGEAPPAEGSYRAIHEDLGDFLAFRQWALGKL